MDIRILSTYDVSGGAGRAAYRLHSGLRGLGHESRMIVRRKSGSDDSVHSIVVPAQRGLENRLFFMHALQAHAVDANRTGLSDTYFSLPQPGFDLSGCHLIRDADVINLHWVAGFQSPQSIAKLFDLNRPLVWTLHDQGAFSGGCHYSAGCTGYRETCHACPQLVDNPFDFPSAVLEDKRVCYGYGTNTPVVVVTPSRWLADCARNSRVFRHARIETIANGLETDVFVPRDSAEAKARFGLYGDTTTLLFCSERVGEKRKGFHLLNDILEACGGSDELRRRLENGRFKILCIGRLPEGFAPDSVPIVPLGHLASDEEIAWAYAAADVFILPSTEDNLPNTVLEAMSCGTPVAAFDAGGVPEAVTDGVTGRLAAVGDAAGLGRAVSALVLDGARRAEMGRASRAAVERRYALTSQAACYADLFQDLIGPSGGRPRAGGSPLRAAEAPEIEAVPQSAGGLFAALGDRLMLPALEDLVPRLNDRLAESEADRAARLEVINDCHRQLEEAHAAWQQTAKSYQTQIHQAQVARVVMQQQINALDIQVRQLMTTEQSLRNLVRNTMRRFGLLNFVHHHSRLFNRVYRGTLRTASALLPRWGRRPRNDAQFLDAPVVEALIRARGMTGGLDERALVGLFEWGAGLGSVLCLSPSDGCLQATFMLSQAGAVASAIAPESRLAYLVDALGILPIPERFESWAGALEPAALSGIDALVLDPGIGPEELERLRGHLCVHHRLLVTGCASPEDHPLSQFNAPARSLHGVFVVEAPPSDWLAAGESVRPAPFDATLPSGRPWPKISVVTVTLNQGAFLEQTLRSVLDQGYPNLEYIVLDGGSSDNTGGILDAYRDRLSVCVSQPDRGQSDALNRGFSLSSGHILAWLNSDDRYLPNTLRKVALAFDRHDTDMVAGACALIRDFDPAPFDTHHSRLPYGQPAPLPMDRLLDIDGAWQQGDFFYQPEVFWTREIWEKSGGRVDESLYYSMDYELWVRMARQGAVITHIPDALALYRVHEKQKTVGEDLPFLDELRRVNREFLAGKR